MASNPSNSSSAGKPASPKQASALPAQPMPSGVEIAPGVYLPESEVRFTFARSSGPGGQNVNKLSTKARLEVSFDVLESVLGENIFRRLLEHAGAVHQVVSQRVLVVSCDSSRSQVSNRQACLAMLRQWVLEAKKPRKNRRPTKPTRGSQRRRVEAKKQRGQRKAERGRRLDSDA